MHFAVDKAAPAFSDIKVSMKLGAVRMMILFLATITTAVCFHNFLHLPPAAGMMLGLGYLGLFSFYVKKAEGREGRYDSILGQRPQETLHPLYKLIKSPETISKKLQDYPEPTFIIDNNHVVTHWNPAMEALSGVREADVIGSRRH